MLRDRIIPCLLLSGSGFVKSKRFANHRYIGDPINTLKLFNDKFADEIIVLDIDASRKGSEINYTLIQELTGELFMPLTYGGGLKSIDEIARIIASGVEKVSINSRNAEDLELIRQASQRYGAQSVVASIDVDRNLFGRQQVVYQSARNKLKTTPEKYAAELEAAGAGEILLQSVFLDGMQTGYDIETVKSVVASVDVPVIALGGAGNIRDMAKVIVYGGAAGAAAGSIFVYHGDLDGILINMPSEEKRIRTFDEIRKLRKR